VSLLVRFGEEVPKAIEATLPERAATGNPAFGYGEACRFHVAGADAADFFRADEAAVFENLEMLDNRGNGDGKRSGEAGDGGRSIAELLDDGAAGGVAEGMEDATDAGSLVKHDL
jgi:hypothetical protein